MGYLSNEGHLPLQGNRRCGQTPVFHDGFEPATQRVADHAVTKSGHLTFLSCFIRIGVLIIISY